MTRPARRRPDRPLFRAARRRRPGSGSSDDAACLSPPPGHDLVVTADALVAGVHFLPGRSAGLDRPQGARREPLGSRRQGRRARRLPADPGPAGRLDGGWLAAFAAGLGRGGAATAAARSSAATRSAPTGPLTLSITALGEVPAGPHGAGAPAPGRATCSASPARSATRRSASRCVGPSAWAG